QPRQPEGSADGGAPVPPSVQQLVDLSTAGARRDRHTPCPRTKGETRRGIAHCELDDDNPCGLPHLDDSSSRHVPDEIRPDRSMPDEEQPAGGEPKQCCRLPPAVENHANQAAVDGLLVRQRRPRGVEFPTHPTEAITR